MAFGKNNKFDKRVRRAGSSQVVVNAKLKEGLKPGYKGGDRLWDGSGAWFLVENGQVTVSDCLIC